MNTRGDLARPIVILSIFLIGACSGGSSGSAGAGTAATGGSCQPCRAAAPQCNAGLTCSSFARPGGLIVGSLCAAADVQKCPDPFGGQ